MTQGFNADLSSQQRALVNKLVASMQALLQQPKVQQALAVMNKGQVIIDVRDGVAVQITPSPEMRKGKELPE
jgi:cell division septal protein FtsQ